MDMDPNRHGRGSGQPWTRTDAVMFGTRSCQGLGRGRDTRVDISVCIDGDGVSMIIINDSKGASHQ